MFCSKNSSMLCMKCFSEASLETRLHCVDIDIAYEQRKKSLDLAISVIIDMRSQSQSFNITEISLPIYIIPPYSLQSVQEIQASLRDGGVVLQSLSDELKRATTREREDIHSLYTSLYETIRTQYEGTMRTIDGWVA